MEIIRDGISYTLTAEELESAYREQQRDYRRADAADALDGYCASLPNYNDVLVAKCGRAYDELIQDVALLDCIVSIFEEDFTCDSDENTMWRNAVEKALDGFNKMYEVITASEKPQVIFANEFSIYEDKVCMVMGQPAGRLTYWCNCLGEINVPGKSLSYSGCVDELPPDVQALYTAYQEEVDGLHLYTVTLNGVNGMLFTALVDQEWVNDVLGTDMDSAYDALKAAALRLRDSRKLHSDVIILAMKNTAPDGHELGIFFPAEICELIPKFLTESVRFSDQIYQWVKDEGQSEAKAESEKKHAKDAIHYLRLRWTACYMLYVDDRFERADNAFHAMADDISAQMSKLDGFETASELNRSEQFVKLLSLNLDRFIGRAREEDSLIEMNLTQKVIEISTLFESK